MVDLGWNIIACLTGLGPARQASRAISARVGRGHDHQTVLVGGPDRRSRSAPRRGNAEARLTRVNVNLDPATVDPVDAAVADSGRSRTDTINVAIRAFPWLLARAWADDLTVVRYDGQIERVVLLFRKGESMSWLNSRRGCRAGVRDPARCGG